MSESKHPDWFQGHTPPFVIAGPCSAESELQLLQTAHALASLPEVRLLRAGLWKPRTRPGGFEGVGEEGLSWLLRARSETGLGIATEVATPAHVALALSHKLDLIWLGARTTANPFAVQALADALRGAEVMIAIKNPINPDLGLWRGAVERLRGVGLKKLILVHRGFTRYERSEYRNPPMWSLPIEMMRLYPELPMLCDPSHIAGQRSLIEPLMGASMGMGMAGLMVEVHRDPDAALTDAAQQILPQDFKAMLDRLVCRQGAGEDAAFAAQLRRLRGQIDRLDEELLDVLVRRLEVVGEIGERKVQAKVSALQIDRWTEVLRGRVARGEERGMSGDFIRSLFELLHAESVHVQAVMMGEAEPASNQERKDLSSQERSAAGSAPDATGPDLDASF